jgi:regulator of cell morphogenesis and NO signaling
LQIGPYSNKDEEKTPVEQGILAGIVLASIHAPAATHEPGQGRRQESLSELIRYIIRTHHDFIREELPRLHGLAERVIAKRNGLNPELIDLTCKLRRLAGDLTFHMSHSENNVFPYIEELERCLSSGAPLSPSTTQGKNLIQEVMVGHAAAGEMLQQIETDTNRFTPPEDACPDLVSLYEGLKELARRRSSHIQLEGFVLFPRALALEKQVLAA